MIKSMTGFGDSICIYGDTMISIDIRAVNSKIFDPSQKLPPILKNKEQDIRAILSKTLERGKIDLNISIDRSSDILEYSINKDKVKLYYRELKNLFSELDIHINDAEFLDTIMKMPDVITNQQEVVSPELWDKLEQELIVACELLCTNRLEEGRIMEQDFLLRITLIQEYLQKIECYEKNRIDTVKNRIYKQLSDLVQLYDENRLEQELIFYLEKLDITEEKVRLKKHCEYFIETMNEQTSNGKKLSFISQEIGREINTLGSKAYDVDIQKLVVQMKDELEKIKEQLANVL
ncbi:MAG: YicC family protein [Bacteroidales bacterium]|nr:YicC family protein [Bacteroidales bacterium]